jgi:pyocin large subunit-like protein
MTWAFAQDIDKSIDKFVLVALSDYVNEASGNTNIWPSVYNLAEKTSLDRRTVMTSLKRLVKSGYLRDTGRRVGKTKSIKVYQVLGIPKSSEAVTFLRGSSSKFARSSIKFANRISKESIRKRNGDKNDTALPPWGEL